ncbi:MAG: molybdopterin cofactor-binding domain-containing protein [Bacillota bacterium]|nr:molybdopterin cofactor-binding domain-containing protein [Bacillota bacterium]
MTGPISFKVNGLSRQVEGPGNISLLDYLRSELGLMGTKKGCNQGHCGSCTVLIDGKAKRACTVKINRLTGSQIETIENLASNGQLHPLQEAFIREGAVQCGFCTPGMIMATKALLDVNTDPSPEEIKEALRFNLCRCTGYAAIVRAVQLAAQNIRGEIILSRQSDLPRDSRIENSLIGASPLKKDALPKVQGTPIYADDLNFEGQLFGKLLLSRYPSARIKKIEIQKALAQPGVKKILLADDIPGRNGFGLLNPHQPVLAGDQVRYTGEPVALVLAESETEAEAALPFINVDYEMLPGIFSAKEGLVEKAFSLHPEGNMAHHIPVRKGDTEKAFKEAAVIIEGVYRTPAVEHAYLEPEAAVSRMDSNGVVSVWTASQGSHAFRDMIAATLNLPTNKVRVIYTPAGGAFGGKEEPTVQIHCALGTLVTGRPVKMTLTRRESLIISTKRHSAEMHYRHGATADGRIIAMEAKIFLDAGAYESLSKPVVFRAGIIAAGPYSIPNVKTDAYGVYTNNPPSGAFRGFGTTQVAFGSEMQMDKLAEALQMDPFDLREINSLASGKTTITGQVINNDCGYLKALEAVKNSLQSYKKMLHAPTPGKRIGIGIAGAYKNVGLGAGKNDQAGAKIEIDLEGNLILKVGATDMGQGSDTALTQLAAQETGLPYEDFQVLSNDTAQTPDGGITTASRQTYISGHAVLGAANIFNSTLRKCIAECFGFANIDYKFAPGGLIILDQPDRFISYHELARTANRAGFSLAGEYTYTAPTTYPLRERADHEAHLPLEKYNVHFTYCYAAQAAVVEVDESSGEVKVLKIIAAQDLGRAIHYQNSCCQIEGAVVMGVGYGMSEKFIMEQGYMITDNLAKIGLTRIRDIPDMEIILVEEESDGPYGAKGMGELPLNPTAPAIINAINNATGVRITDLPATKRKIAAELKKIKGEQ